MVLSDSNKYTSELKSSSIPLLNDISSTSLSSFSPIGVAYTPSSIPASQEEQTFSSTVMEEVVTKNVVYKTLIGVIVGLLSLFLIILIAVTYMNKYELYPDPSIDYIPKLGKKLLLNLSVFSLFLACTSIVLIILWVQDNLPNSLDQNFLGSPNWQSNIFSYHPLLMTLFVVFQIFAILTWSLISFNTIIAKIFHILLQTAALICMCIGLGAIVTYKNSYYIPQLVSMHSWIGM